MKKEWIIGVVEKYQDFDLIEEKNYRNKYILDFYLENTVVLSVFYVREPYKKFRVRNVDMLLQHQEHEHHLCIFISHNSQKKKFEKYLKFWNLKFPKIFDLNVPGRLTRTQFIPVKS